MKAITTLLTCAIGLCVALTTRASAGDLNPPAGPVAPTMKDLATVEPRVPVSADLTPGDADSLFRISRPGSYYLIDDITGVAGSHGIEIAASDVTLDLNGFVLSGVVGSLDGITCDLPGAMNLSIRNGTIRNWGDDGIDISSANNSEVKSVRADSNAVFGIRVGAAILISHCVADSNGADGFNTNSTCVIMHCTATQNLGRGITTGSRNVISHCAAASNVSDGIVAGIAGSEVVHCVSGVNGGDGISLSNFSTAFDCTVQSNGGAGIRGNMACTIARCSAAANISDGILIGDQCRVMSSVSDFNGNGGNGAGIHATGSDNRIEDNQCTRNDRGIDVDSAGNLIIKNTCAANATSWDIAANNVVGPILDRTAPGSGAILGNSAPSSLGTTDANANFTY